MWIHIIASHFVQHGNMICHHAEYTWGTDDFLVSSNFCSSDECCFQMNFLCLLPTCDSEDVSWVKTMRLPSLE